MRKEDIRKEAEWLFDRLANAESETDRAYHQGRIDSLAWVLRHENLGSILIEREGASK